jgi:hypothetical protein
MGEIRVFGWQGTGEIGQRLSLPLMQLGRDMMDQDIAAPPMLDRCLEVPFPSRLICEAVEQNHMVPPGQLCSKLLHNWLLGPGPGERPHIFETARAEALDPGKLRLQILGQPIDDLSAPPFRLLLVPGLATNIRG